MTLSPARAKIADMNAITPAQAQLISNFKTDLVGTLSEKQTELIADFWKALQATLNPVQKMIVTEIVKVVSR